MKKYIFENGELKETSLSIDILKESGKIYAQSFKSRVEVLQSMKRFSNKEVERLRKELEAAKEEGKKLDQALCLEVLNDLEDKTFQIRKLPQYVGNVYQGWHNKKGTRIKVTFRSKIELEEEPKQVVPFSSIKEFISTLFYLYAKVGDKVIIQYDTL